jgi:RNA polymerase sigma-70 factor (ECF subfamily)
MNQSGEQAEAGAVADRASARSDIPLIAAKEEFDHFYHREYQSILALALVMTGDRQQAEDLTQDAFVAAYQKWETIDSPRAWIRTVVANRSRSWFRKRYREARAMLRVGQPTPAAPADMGAETTEFWGEVRLLPSRQAQAVALFYLDQLSTVEIASILGCSESTVRVHLTRGRRALAERLRAEQ